MPISFPSSPSTNQTYSYGGRVYKWSGAAWEFVATSPADDARWNLFLPPAPTNLVGVSGNAQVVLTWTAPIATYIPPITDYVVQYSSNSGSTWTTFSDGTSTATSATVTGLTNGTAYVFRVAAVNGVGTGAYTSASSSVTPAPGDPYFSNVSLLLHMNGSGSTFADSSSSNRTITASNVTQTADQSKFGGKSGYFAGNGYLSVPSSADFAFGTGDFAIEFWVRFSSLGGTQGLVCSDANGGLDVQFRGGIGLGLGAYSQWQATFSWSPSANTWYYVAVARTSGTVRAYVDGALIGTEASTLTSLEGTSNNIIVGNGDGFLDGYLDEVRITKGSSRMYTGSTIAVPTAAFPDA